MVHQKFDLAKLERLNDPGRFETLSPDAMWSALGRPRGVRTIVEIGAGTGMFASAFAHFAPGSRVYAADIAPEMVEWMRENRPEVQEGSLIPLVAEESHVPLPDGFADLVAMVNLHHELADPAASYAEAFRLLTVGGRILMVDWEPGDSPKGPQQRIRISSGQAETFLREAGFGEVVSHPELPWAWMVTGRRI